MGSLGFTEIFVVLVVALLVLGPARLPDAARSMGKALRELRNLTSGFEREVRAAFDDPDTPASRTADDQHGIDPGALAPGMSYGRPVDAPPVGPDTAPNVDSAAPTPSEDDPGVPGDRAS